MARLPSGAVRASQPATVQRGKERRRVVDLEVLRKVEHPVSHWKRSKVYFPEPLYGEGLVTPTPPARDVPPVPLRPAHPGSLTRIA
jgi:hypothetical protein